MGDLLLNRKNRQPVSFIRYSNLPYIVNLLNNLSLDKMELVRTANGSVEGVLLGKSVYDSLIFNATGAVPDFTLLVFPDDWIATNIIKVLQALIGEINYAGLTASSLCAFGVTMTANSSTVQAYLLSKEYYDALIALQP